MKIIHYSSKLFTGVLRSVARTSPCRPQLAAALASHVDALHEAPPPGDEAADARRNRERQRLEELAASLQGQLTSTARALDAAVGVKAAPKARTPEHEEKLALLADIVERFPQVRSLVGGLDEVDTGVALPPNWIEARDNGRVYFFNTLTGESQWHRPLLENGSG